MNRDKTSGMKLDFIQPEIIAGQYGIKHTDSEVAKEVSKWEFAVVGYHK